MERKSAIDRKRDAAIRFGSVHYQTCNIFCQRWMLIIMGVCAYGEFCEMTLGI